MTIKIPAVGVSAFHRYGSPPTSINGAYVSSFVQLEDVPDPPIEITARNIYIASFLKTPIASRLSKSVISSIVEDHDKINLQLTELEHIVKALNLIWEDDSIVPIAAMFSIGEVAWIQDVFTNSTLELISEPAAPCVGDMKMQYNRIVDDVYFDVTLDGELVDYPLMTNLIVGSPAIEGAFISFTVLTDSLLFKKDVRITFNYTGDIT